ncbi:hypothetical protein BC629DRAFT_1434455 [Irpex lacteus]|nr:hypothetical protein BC629DRAFT_1434455 [Irpex lacteus]
MFCASVQPLAWEWSHSCTSLRVWICWEWWFGDERLQNNAVRVDTEFDNITGNKAVIQKSKNYISSQNIKNHMTSIYFDVKWIYMSSGPDFSQDSEFELRILIGEIFQKIWRKYSQSWKFECFQ